MMSRSRLLGLLCLGLAVSLPTLLRADADVDNDGDFDQADVNAF